MAPPDPLGRSMSGVGFGRGAGGGVRPLPASSLPEDAYQGALEHLANAKFDRRHGGEDMRFFHMLMDRGAMDTFVPPERNYNVKYRNPEVVNSDFRYTANNPEFQSLQSPTDILLTQVKPSQWWTPVAEEYVSFRPYAGSPLAQLDLQGPDDRMGRRAMAAYLSGYDLPVVDKDLEQYMLQLGTGNEEVAKQIFARSELLPDVIRPDTMNFLSDLNPNWVASTRTNVDDMELALQDVGINWNNLHTGLYSQPPEGTSIGRWAGHTVSHEAGHWLDRLSALRDRDPYRYSSTGPSYRQSVSADISNLPDVSGMVNPVVGWGQQNPSGEYLTQYAADSASGANKDVEDFAERFSLYMDDRQNGYAYMVGGRPVRFAEVYPATAAYFEELLRQLEAGYEPGWRLLE